ncbi:hypothetical protein BCR44DRAFT_1451081 [Catenaria anguillulae PL171]|uniref:Uncharacterized protein n=1 Tax=Catenaria anguillulae PL171 TaxID=765915 RepID=A0A1Y2H5Z0_9FUNG|nr:hypothetical protein BCR44DRAFT_1451081 [Catenaria anguillulae PL171]
MYQLLLSGLAHGAVSARKPPTAPSILPYIQCDLTVAITCACDCLCNQATAPHGRDAKKSFRLPSTCQSRLAAPFVLSRDVEPLRDATDSEIKLDVAALWVDYSERER